MAQNTSSAVMAQRKEPPDSLDFFPTPPWATRALCEHVLGTALGIKTMEKSTAWEPAAGEGHMVGPLMEYFRAVHSSDVHNYGPDTVQHDFLMPCDPPFGEVEWIITNPPFRLAEQFIERGLDIATEGVAMLVRTVFLESIGRYENLFRDRPPSIVAPFTERVTMLKGRLADPKARGTATSYAWFVWDRRAAFNRTIFWIPPCRKALERPGDYKQPMEAI